MKTLYALLIVSNILISHAVLGDNMTGLNDAHLGFQHGDIESLVSAIETLTKRVTSIENTKCECDRIKRGKRQTIEQPAFTAYLDDPFTLESNGVLIFNHILYDYGGDYNTGNGIFTAPTSGIYLFSFHIEHFLEQVTHARLMVDGIHQVMAVIASSEIQSTQSGNLAIIGLKRGQMVWVELEEGSVYGGAMFRGTTFAGALLV